MLDFLFDKLHFFVNNNDYVVIYILIDNFLFNKDIFIFLFNILIFLLFYIFLSFLIFIISRKISDKLKFKKIESIYSQYYFIIFFQFLPIIWLFWIIWNFIIWLKYKISNKSFLIKNFLSIILFFLYYMISMFFVDKYPKIESLIDKLFLIYCFLLPLFIFIISSIFYFINKRNRKVIYN